MKTQPLLIRCNQKNVSFTKTRKLINICYMILLTLMVMYIFHSRHPGFTSRLLHVRIACCVYGYATPFMTWRDLYFFFRIQLRVTCHEIRNKGSQFVPASERQRKRIWKKWRTLGYFLTTVLPKCKTCFILRYLKTSLKKDSESFIESFYVLSGVFH
jgi:hypothetical protein